MSQEEEKLIEKDKQLIELLFGEDRKFDFEENRLILEFRRLSGTIGGIDLDAESPLEKLIRKAYRAGKLAGFEEVEQERKYLQIGISNCVPSDEYRKGAERMNFQMKVFLNEKLGSKDIVCTFCNGTGAYKGKLKYAYCPGCQGTGKV